MVQAGFVRTIGELSNAATHAGEERMFGFAEEQQSYDRPVVERMISRPFREAAFAAGVKQAYANTCAMTGLSIINGGGRAEVQAAHIRPVAHRGPDSIRNGRPLPPISPRSNLQRLIILIPLESSMCAKFPQSTCTTPSLRRHHRPLRPRAADRDCGAEPRAPSPKSAENGEEKNARHSAACRPGFSQRPAAASSVSLAATQAVPCGRSSRFQNGARVLR